MRFYPKLLAGVTAAVAVIAPAVSLGAATPRCAPANLRLDAVRGLGAANARDWDFALRNVGAQTCHLYGYPGIGLLDRHAQLMHVTVLRRSGIKTTVVLRPWQRAYFTFHYEANGPCPAGIFPSGLQVIPPGATQGLRFYGPFGECAGDHPDVSTVRAVLGSL